MARTNKYASLNFNDIYEKKIISNPTNNPNPSSSSSSNLTRTKISNSRIHGNMLVLSRPTPKPISIPSQTPPSQLPNHQNPPPVNQDPTRVDSDSDSISLRPLGRTGGSAVAVSRSPRGLCSVSPKSDRFVPPHLRPGYVCKEEKPVSPAVVKDREFSGGYRRRNFGEEGRPKSGGGGGGYERMRRGSGPDFVEMYRPGSSGSRPNSSG